jgi:ABC-type dipeptide/oligopeptide/nickel transport system permease subunit
VSRFTLRASLAVMAGDFLTPYSYRTLHDQYGFHPPMLTRVHWRDEAGRWTQPFVYGIAITQARVARGLVLSLKEREFVLAARALGANDARILFKHILPHTLPTVLVTAAASLPYLIFAEVGLSFLGLGIQEPEASWGNLLTVAQNIRYLIDFPWLLLPSVGVFVVVLAWQSLSDGLSE